MSNSSNYLLLITALFVGCVKVGPPATPRECDLIAFEKTTGPELDSVTTSVRLYGDGYLDVRFRNGWHRSLTICRLESMEIDNWYRLCGAGVNPKYGEAEIIEKPSKRLATDIQVHLNVFRDGAPLGETKEIFAEGVEIGKDSRLSRVMQCVEGLIAAAKDCRFRIFIFDPHKPEEVEYYEEGKRRAKQCRGSPTDGER